MKRIDSPVAIASRSFSKHPVLRGKAQARFSNIRFNDQGLSLQGSPLIDFLKGCHGAIIALETINSGVLSALPQLKVIAKYGVGLDNLDLEALKKHGVQLGWTGGVNARSVSELALAFVLGSLHNVFVSSQRLAAGQWKTEGGQLLSNKTVGIIGCGHIGKDFVRMLAPFQCRILINDILPMGDFCKTTGAVQVDKEILLKESDVVSLHIPYNQSTHGFLSASEFNFMKPSSLLINTSRGSIVDETALERALVDRRISAACMDVFEREPDANPKLFSLPGFIGTPHIGGASDEAILAMGMAAIDNLAKYF